MNISGPFNPFTLNLTVAILAIIGLFHADELPSALRCLRDLPEKTRPEQIDQIIYQ